MNEKSNITVSSKPNHDGHNQSAGSTDALKQEIKESQAQIGETLAALGEKIKPEHIKQEAGEMLTEAKDFVKNKVKNEIIEMKDDVVDATKKTTDHMIQETKNFTDKVVHDAKDFMQHSPTGRVLRSPALPWSMVGIGLGWLVWRGTRATHREVEASSGKQSKKHKDATLVDSLQDKTSEVLHKTRDEISRLDHGIKDSFFHNPLAYGAVAFGAGAVAGFLLPSSRVENHLLEESRQGVAKKIKETVQHARESSEKIVTNAAEGVLSEL